MNIGILGSGTVGKTLGAKLAELGHDVMVGTRSPEKLRDWAETVGARAGLYADAASFGEILVYATRGDA
jgi:8-hydroxy-5-deazaflavin:NADPH oxidoreductase